jgi:hypothetical protein
MASVGQVAVIVAQRGGSPEAAVEARQAEAPTVVLLHQEPGESLGGLGQRVRACAKALVSDGWRIRSATFVAHKDFGIADLPATSELLRSLITSMVGAGEGRVYLQSQGEGTRSHFALQALAFAISDQVRGTGVEIVTGGSARGHAAAGLEFGPAVA